MIEFAGRLSYHPRTFDPSRGLWHYGVRTSAQDIVISCDEPGCLATVVPVGIEHNGPVVECIYIPKGQEGWRLREIDLCPAHAPLDAEDDEG